MDIDMLICYPRLLGGDMSGHSKWASIKHKKGAADAKRGKIFTKMIREITVAAREGGGDPDSNPRLRTAILKARSVNMPKDLIDRATKKGSGDSEGSSFIEISYEGYAPGGVALLVDCLTDNRNRTTADVRYAFNKCNGNMGETGCVSYLFSRKAMLYYDAETYDEETLLEPALEAGILNITTGDGLVICEAEPENFSRCLEHMQEHGFQHKSADIEKISDTIVSMNMRDAEKVIKLVDMLEELDDVQAVFSNFDIVE